MLGCEIRITFAGGGNSVIGSQVVVVNSGQAYIISGPLMENGHVGDVIDTIFFGDPLLAAPHEPWGAGSGTGRLQFLVVG
jgi:methylglyoxal synthase